jgi:putative hydrolase of the HAD superfamily
VAAVDNRPHAGFEAVVLDVGGVIFVPDVSLVADDLASQGIAIDVDIFRRAHYYGMLEVDKAPRGKVPADLVDPGRGSFGGLYVQGLAKALDPSGLRVTEVSQTLVAKLSGPACEIWKQPVPGTAETMRDLTSSGIPVAIVSNSDGTVEDKLRTTATCQVGPGDGVEVAAVVDSAVVGIWKPEPGIFSPALSALGLTPDRVAYAGDSLYYDVGGALAAGLTPLHFDPFDLCRRRDHAHISALADVMALC